MGFKFGASNFTVEVEGKNYTAVHPLSEKLIADVQAISKEFSRLIDEKTEDPIAVCDAIDKGIDIIFGQGAADKMFFGREKDAYERGELFFYIFSELISYANAKQGAVLSNVRGKENTRKHYNRRRSRPY